MPARQPFFPVSSVPWLATAGALAALCIAWLAQYGFGLAPCELCYWQRYAYGVVIAFGIAAILQPARSTRRRAMLWLLGLACLGVAAIALFHVGVEQKWWQGFTACTGQFGTGLSTDDFLNAIENAPIVRCDEPAWTLFGISMAGYNVLYALALAVFVFRGASRSKA